jgi:NADH-quinone oxidoreductase subunit D
MSTVASGAVTIGVSGGRAASPALRLTLELDEERVVSSAAFPGDGPGVLEKLAEGHRYRDVPELFGRMGRDADVHAGTAFSMAVERSAAIDVPARAHWIRSLVLECGRVASHLSWLSAFAIDAGAGTASGRAAEIADRFYALLEAIGGNPGAHGYVVPGGVASDLPAGADEALSAASSALEDELPDLDRLLRGSRGLLARVQGVGVIDRDASLDCGLTGCSLRASGVGFDVRRDAPYAAYSDVEFEVALGTVGDCWDRYAVHVEEVRWSGRLIDRLLDGLPDGPCAAKVPKGLRLPAGEAYASVESPRGELGVHLISVGSGGPYRLRLRLPSYYNLGGIPEACRDSLFEDVPLIVSSLDIDVAEAGA